MNILITGATGFIGKNLVRRLVHDRAGQIICLVRRTSDISEFKALGVGFVFGDICDPVGLDAIDFSVDLLFHCAAYVDDRDMQKLRRVNVEGTENIFRFAFERKVKKVVYISSVAVISGNHQVPLVDELPYASTNNYGASKVDAEKIAVKYRDKGMKVAILRPCMVYGAEEPHILSKLIKALKWRMVPVFDGGRTKLHLVYIQTVVDALILCMNDERCLEGTFMVADKEVLTYREALTIMARAIGAPEPVRVPVWAAKILFALPLVGKKLKFLQKDRVYSAKRLEDLGFQCRFSGPDALAGSVKGYML